MVGQRSLFFPARDERLARDISITSPSAFRKSIRTIRKGGVTVKERRGLVLAQNRADAQLNRKNLSPKERREFSEIVRIRIPKVTRRR